MIMKTGANVADTFHENIVDIAIKSNIGSHIYSYFVKRCRNHIGVRLPMLKKECLVYNSLFTY